VIDSGVGERNGGTVVRVAQKPLAKGSNLYLTNTHYHSEHPAGEQAFPASTIILRLALQQEEMNKKSGRSSRGLAGICRPKKQKEPASGCKISDP